MIISANATPDEVQKKIFQELRKGSSDSRHPFRYFSLATHDINKEEPNIRMVILRKISDDWRIFVYTDARTAKVDELKQLDRAALLFWHPHHKTQATFKTTATLHHNNEVAQDFWKQDVHGPAQKAYSPLVSPGTEIDRPEDAYQWPEEYDSSHFCVLELRPYNLQVLQIERKKHRRLSCEWKEEAKEWSGKWIAP